MSKFWTIFIVCIFVNLLFFGKFTQSVSAQYCPAGSSCLGESLWDRPDGCQGPFGDLPGYYTQAYVRSVEECDAYCVWYDWGFSCDFNTGGEGSVVIASGSCCTNVIGGTVGDGCHYVSDDGCYTGNCPDDLTGHGRGSCAVNQYYCTGGHTVGDCCTPSWSACSVSCGGGISTDGCGSTMPCNTQSCCTPSWGACSALCGGGVELDGCGGSRACNTQACRWWQTKDGDVTTNGDLTSVIPSGQYFGLAGGGGYSGVPAYGGTTSLTTSSVSEDGWLVNSAYSSAKLYNSIYFANAVPSEVTVNSLPSNSVAGSFFESGGEESFGYYWYEYDATTTHLDLTIISGMNLGSRKVILIVKGANLNLGGNINLTDGEGFFLGVTSGNMVVSPEVTSLEGIYVSDGSFSTGTLGAGSDSQLWVRGTIAGFGGISLQRDLSVNTTSAELFEYAPDQDLLFPAKLGARPNNWREVAP